MRIAAISCLLLTLLVAAPAARSLTDLPGRLRSTHGDWRVHCQSPDSGQTENCAALIAVEAPGEAGAGMTVIILKSADRRQLLLRVVTPLGILLDGKHGELPIAVDGKSAGTIEIIRCKPEGCVGELQMPQACWVS